MQSFSIWRGEPEAHTGGAPRGCRYRLASCASSQGIPLHSPPPTPCRIQYLGQLPSMCCHMWLDCSGLYNEMLTWCCASLQIILPHPVIRTSGLQTRGCSYPSGSILPRYPSRAITPSLRCSLPYASRPFGGAKDTVTSKNSRMTSSSSPSSKLSVVCSCLTLTPAHCASHARAQTTGLGAPSAPARQQ